MHKGLCVSLFPHCYPLFFLCQNSLYMFISWSLTKFNYPKTNWKGNWDSTPGKAIFMCIIKQLYLLFCFIFCPGCLPLFFSEFLFLLVVQERIMLVVPNDVFLVDLEQLCQDRVLLKGGDKGGDKGGVTQQLPALNSTMKLRNHKKSTIFLRRRAMV